MFLSELCAWHAEVGLYALEELVAGGGYGGLEVSLERC